jgi:DNA-binding NtrC family response regulator
LPEHIRKNISEKIRKECDEKEIKEFVNLKERIKILEKEAIREAMEITGNNKQKAAQLLGMSRSNFYEKLDKYNI